MKTTTNLLSVAAILVASAFSVSVLAKSPYTAAASNTSATGSVDSESQASASSHGTGAASASTVSGSFSQFGTIVGYTPATLPEGSTSVKGGTVDAAGFTNTQGYAGSTSTTTGTGRADASSQNSASGHVTAFLPITTIGVGKGTVSGMSESDTKLKVSTAATGTSTSTKGKEVSNQGGFTATESLIQTQQSVAIGGIVIPTTLNQTETSSKAFNVSTQGDLAGWTNTISGKVRSSNSGNTSAVAN